MIEVQTKKEKPSVILSKHRFETEVKKNNDGTYEHPWFYTKLKLNEEKSTDKEIYFDFI